MRFRRGSQKVGSRPGTLAIPEDSPPPKITLVEYDAEQVKVEEVNDVQRLAACLENPMKCWVDVQGLGDEAVLRQLAEVFSLSPFVLEDAVNIPQRAKTEPYPQYQVVIARSPRIEPPDDLTLPQVCFVVGDNWLLTFQERYLGFFEPVRQRIREGIGLIRKRKADYLAYAMIDTLVDWYYPIIEDIAERLDEMETDLDDETDVSVINEIRRIRRRVVDLHRIGRPQRNVIGELVRTPSAFFSDEVRTFFRDTENHISQIMELTDSARETTASLAEHYMANISFRSNEIMKVLTLMASIFIPLTFIAGIYGMNFENMPELTQPRAYFFVLIIMIVVAVGMLGYFRHRGWIGRRKRARTLRRRAENSSQSGSAGGA